MEKDLDSIKWNLANGHNLRVKKKIKNKKKIFSGLQIAEAF